MTVVATEDSSTWAAMGSICVGVGVGGGEGGDTVCREVGWLH